MNTVVRLPIQGEKETVAVDAALAHGHTLVAFRVTQDHSGSGIRAGDIGIVGTSRWEGPGRPMLLGHRMDVVCWRSDGTQAYPGTPLGWLLLTVEDAAASDDRRHVIHHPGVVPDFGDGAREAEFWATHRLAGDPAQDAGLWSSEIQEPFSERPLTLLQDRLMSGALARGEPRPVESEADLDAALAELDVLDELAREDLSHPLSGYLQALIARIVAYEARAYPMLSVPPHETLEFLLENKEMSAAELATRLGEGPETVRELLKGNLDFADGWIDRLSEVLGVNREVFLDDDERREWSPVVQTFLEQAHVYDPTAFVLDRDDLAATKDDEDIF